MTPQPETTARAQALDRANRESATMYVYRSAGLPTLYYVRSSGEGSPSTDPSGGAVTLIAVVRPKRKTA